MKALRWMLAAFAVGFLVLSGGAAEAQNKSQPCYDLNVAGAPCQGVGTTKPLPVAIFGASGAVSHASTTALGTSLVAKATAGNLYGYNCSAITGGAAGFCIAYNGTAAPGTGALTGSLVLDFCYHDTTARGCSLSRIPLAAAYSVGIVILETSAVTPYTYTTGTNTAAISADYQ